MGSRYPPLRAPKYRPEVAWAAVEESLGAPTGAKLVLVAYTNPGA